jgi:hypothetical protein
MSKLLLVSAMAAALGGCALQRAEIAADARRQMHGMTKEQVLGCMGPPISRAAEGATEVWTYNSGGETRTFGHTSTFGNAYGTGTAYGNNMSAMVNSTASTNGFGMTQLRYCVVNVSIVEGHVTTVNYSGPTGSLLTAGEQCAYAVSNCVHVN